MNVRVCVKGDRLMLILLYYVHQCFLGILWDTTIMQLRQSNKVVMTFSFYSACSCSLHGSLTLCEVKLQHHLHEINTITDSMPAMSTVSMAMHHNTTTVHKNYTHSIRLHKATPNKTLVSRPPPAPL